jgi:hypothetical protein
MSIKEWEGQIEVLTFTGNSQENYTVRFADVRRHKSPDEVNIAPVASCSDGYNQSCGTVTLSILLLV